MFRPTPHEMPFQSGVKQRSALVRSARVRLTFVLRRAMAAEQQSIDPEATAILRRRQSKLP